MIGIFDIRMGDKIVGKAQVEREGLYYRFSCRVILPGQGMYRLLVRVGEIREDLGVCIPMGSQFGVEKKIPCKRLGEGIPEFILMPKDGAPRTGTFVPVYPEEPFAYIRRLENAFLAHRDGQIGIMIPEQNV